MRDFSFKDEKVRLTETGHTSYIGPSLPKMAE